MQGNVKGVVQVSVSTGLILLVALIFLFVLGKREYVSGAILGYFVSLINILFSFLSIRWAFEKPNKTFFKVVLGGMGARYVFLLSSLYVVWEFMQIPIVGFVASLLGFYLTMQVFEIRYIQSELENRKVTT